MELLGYPNGTYLLVTAMAVILIWGLLCYLSGKRAWIMRRAAHAPKFSAEAQEGPYCPYCGTNKDTMGPCTCTDREKAKGGYCVACGAPPNQDCYR